MRRILNKICRRRERAARNLGFTLIEILVAIFTISVVLLGLAPMAVNVIHYNNFSKNRAIAVMLAQSKIEDLRRTALSTTLDDANDGTESNIDANGVAGNGIFTREANITGGADLLTTIEVEVRWTDYAAHTVTQTTTIWQD